MSLTLAATVLVAGPTHAQDGAAEDTEAFQAAVTEARDAAQAAIDEADLAIFEGCVGLAGEACLQRYVAVQLPTIADELATYAELLEATEVPDVYADDVAAQIVALREVATIMQTGATAAEAADDVLLGEHGQAASAVQADLAGRLSPDYARFAFLSSFRDVDFVSVYGGSTPAELAYLDGIGSVGEAGASNFSCFGQALQVSYGGTDALLGALYDCGAGTVLEAIEERGKLLTPPERFADEHDWWLEASAESTRLDRLIGEAAREGDVVKFLANNIRLGNTFRPYPELDRAFAAATGAGALASTQLDVTSDLARSAYGRELFTALVAYGAVSPLLSGIEGIDFPQVPRAVALGAITELAPELRALQAEVRGAIEALEPPEELAADHALMLDFFSLRHDDLEKLIEAAASGDVDASFAIAESIRPTYCAAVASLSDAIAPVAAVIFTPDDPDCR